MRISVWSFDANPDVDPPLCRKSVSYCEDLMMCGQLRPLDPDDIRKGCIGLARLNLRADANHEASLSRAAGGGFDAAWGIQQSGWAGPLVWQLRTH